MMIVDTVINRKVDNTKVSNKNIGIIEKYYKDGQ